MTTQFGTFLKEKNSTSEYSNHEYWTRADLVGPHEANRNMRVKVFKTLEDIKKDNLKENFTSINNVRDFLQDTNHSVCSEDDNLPKDSNQLERRIIKQQYLVNNNLFDPADYFGGLEVSNLEDNFTDQRLFDDMLFYLPTEMEEVHQDHDNFLKERSKKNESNNIPKKIESSYKLPSHNKTPSMAKAEATKNILKIYPETTKENKEIQFTENPCSILNSHAKSKAESDKDSIQSTSASAKLRTKFTTSSQKSKLNSSTNSSQELKSVANGLFKRKITSESNNKENKEDQAGPRNKLSSSTIKSSGLQDNKGCFRKAFESNAKRSLNTSSQNSKTEKSFSNQNRSFASSSINKSLSSIQANKLEFQNKQVTSEELPIKKKINKRVMSVSKPKVENQSSIRSKTKSIDRSKEMKANNNRSRDVHKNFSSFNGTLNTEEEGDFLFKSYNALTRPRTTNNVQNEENSYVLKGILSPKVNKSLIGGKPNLNKTQKKPEKVVEQKGQPSNPLKFLNDLLNKRKISYSSSDHLRMPKKPTFLGKKNESPTSQIGSKPTKTISKSDNFETKVAGHLRKGQSQSITNYISPTASQKNLI